MDAFGFHLPDTPAPEPAIDTMRPVHEQMLNWVLENPEKGLREMAAHFGYSMSWLSRVMNSDLFRAKLAERQEVLFARIADDIPAKLRGLANVAIERLGEKLEGSEDPRFIRESFDSVMEYMGYGQPRGNGAGAGGINPMQQNNFFVVQKEDLSRLRGSMLEAPRVPATIDGSGQTIPYAAPAQLLTGDSGEPRPVAGRTPALHPVPAQADWSPGGGDSV
jgi:hypothetical protein